MKIFQRLLIGGLMFAVLPQVSMATPTTHLRMQRDVPSEENIVTISSVHIPQGFDSDSDVFVVASGVYPNGCYRWKEAKIENVSDYRHNITAVADVSQGMCIMVLVPFTKEIRLGKLSPGKHNLRFLAGDGTYFEKDLVVE